VVETKEKGNRSSDEEMKILFLNNRPDWHKSKCCPGGDVIAVYLELCGYCMVATWQVCSCYVVATSLLRSCYMTATWLLRGKHVAATWLLRGYFVAATCLLRGCDVILSKLPRRRHQSTIHYVHIGRT
jgi:hypothetical protein